MTVTDVTSPHAVQWKGLRLGVRRRLAAAAAHLRETGMLRRADIMALGEVSVPQASADIKQILLRAPELMRYDASKKGYVRK